MAEHPTLETSRLLLREFTLEDTLSVQLLAGAYEVALNTLLIPHPYPDGAAEEWIRGRGYALEAGNLRLAITKRETGEVVGAIGLTIDFNHHHAEFGYWLGVPFWNQGYCTEAARAMVDYGFGELNLNRIFSTPFSRNPASARVMQKIGMTHEGTMRQHFYKWGEFVDAEYYALLRQDWRPNGTTNT